MKEADPVDLGNVSQMDVESITRCSPRQAKRFLVEQKYKIQTAILLGWKANIYELYAEWSLEHREPV